LREQDIMSSSNISGNSNDQLSQTTASLSNSSHSQSNGGMQESQNVLESVLSKWLEDRKLITIKTELVS
jgi:hypothetical protein